MSRPATRREFLRTIAATAAVAGVGCGPRSQPASAPDEASEPWFRISLAQWSLHRALQSGELDHLDFITEAKRTYGVDGVEYVNSFFKDKALDEAYLNEMNLRCNAEGVTSVLIMCDGEGRLGDPDPAARAVAVANHHRWAEAAYYLGCHSIRVNAASEGSWQEQSALAADGLHRLANYAAGLELNVLVENHGGLSSNGQWLAETIVRADHPRVGTLPDFGNFQTAPGEWYDFYQGVEELMPHARAVSAKSHDFDDATGQETELDYLRLLGLVKDAGYRGWVGIEYEGNRLSEPDGVRATKALLERVRDSLAG